MKLVSGIEIDNDLAKTYVTTCYLGGVVDRHFGIVIASVDNYILDNPSSVVNAKLDLNSNIVWIRDTSLFITIVGIFNITHEMMGVIRKLVCDVEEVE